MKLLMHICCSNCTIYPFQHLLLNNINVRGLWYNPNIHPFTEYSNRMNSLLKLQRLWDLDIEYVEDYPLSDFLAAIVSAGENRCEVCYEWRLDMTARSAVKMNYDAFTTSLLASPYQKFDVIINTGKETAKRHGIDFFPVDFRGGWSISQRLSRELELYRQKYCGCIFSEMERYRKKSQSKAGSAASSIER